MAVGRLRRAHLTCPNGRKPGKWRRQYGGPAHGHRNQRALTDPRRPDRGEPDDPAAVVSDSEPQVWRGQAPDEPRRPGNQRRRINDPGRSDVGDPASHERGRHVAQEERHRGHAGQLGHRHQRDGDEVEHQAGDADAREQRGADREQRRLGADGGGEQSTRHQPNLRGDSLRRLRQHRRDEALRPEQDTGRRPERELKHGIKHQRRVDGDQGTRHHGQGVERIDPMVTRARGEKDHRRHDGAGNRGLRRDNLTVGQQPHDDGERRRSAAHPPPEAQSDQYRTRQHRDVTAGNGNDVVRSGLL